MPTYTKRPETIEAHPFSEKPWPDWAKMYASSIYTDMNGKAWYACADGGMKEIHEDSYIIRDDLAFDLQVMRKETFERRYMEVAKEEVYVEPEPVPPELARVANVLTRSCGK